MNLEKITNLQFGHAAVTDGLDRSRDERTPWFRNLFAF